MQQQKKNLNVDWFIVGRKFVVEEKLIIQGFKFFSFKNGRFKMSKLIKMNSLYVIQNKKINKKVQYEKLDFR